MNKSRASYAGFTNRPQGLHARSGHEWPGARALSRDAFSPTEESPAESLPRVEKQLAVLDREHRELHAAISKAAQAQRKLLAPGELRRGQLEIASEVFPARLLSGDFFNVLDLGDATGLAVGDIAGKGLEAGLWLTCFVGLTRIRTATLPDPAAAASAINRDLCQLQGEAPVAALLLARLEPRRGRLIYCNAGQPSALLFRRNSEVELLDAGGPILGAVPGAAFRNGSTSWAPGDSLVVCSDGVTECQNPVDEEFGAARLLAAARAANPSSATRMLFSILSAVQVFREDRPQHDDMTLAVVRHTG